MESEGIVADKSMLAKKFVAGEAIPLTLSWLLAVDLCHLVGACAATTCRHTLAATHSFTPWCGPSGWRQEALVALEQRAGWFWLRLFACSRRYLGALGLLAIPVFKYSIITSVVQRRGISKDLRTTLPGTTTCFSAQCLSCVRHDALQCILTPGMRVKLVHSEVFLNYISLQSYSSYLPTRLRSEFL